ncbi:MAG TPA: hypothetical protein VLA19_25275 [Herpetosiphonaceae bacterium]|nr:hypothetical protein [Herpetosiphonaceae bacterium]
MSNADGAALPRVVLAYGTIEIDAAVQRAGVAAAAGRCHIVAGITSIPRRAPAQYAGWRFSLSRCGQPPVVISVHRLKRDAEAQLVRVHRASRERDLSDDGVFEAFIQELTEFGDRGAGLPS